MTLNWPNWKLQSPSNRTTYLWWLLTPLGLLLAYLMLSQYLALDTAVQQYFYETTTSKWLIDQNNMVLRWAFYFGPKYAVAAFGFVLIGVVIADWLRGKTTIDRSALLFVIACLILVPAFIGWLKYLTGIPCPYQLHLYGGTFEHKGLFDFWWPDGSHRPRCFPAGHPSGGFALLALVAVSSHRKTMLAIAMTFGMWMSFYQMARGAHFLSHCITTFLLSIVVITLVHLVFQSVKR